MRKLLSYMTALCLCLSMLFAASIPAQAASTTKVKLNVVSTGGSYVGGYDFKLWNSNDHSSYLFHTDSSGTGYQAEDKSAGAYSIIGGDTIEGMTAGTYDILAVLANKGSTNVYPSSISIDIKNSSGSSVSGWPKTFTAPGGVSNKPVNAPQNEGASNTITMDPSGNCRLNNVTFSSSDLAAGNTVIITVTNSIATDEPSSSGGAVVETVTLPSEIVDIATSWYDLIRFRIAPVIAGLVLAVCGLSMIIPSFYGGTSSEKVYSTVAKTAVYTVMGLLLLILLPTVVQMFKESVQAFSWKP